MHILDPESAFEKIKVLTIKGSATNLIKQFIRLCITLISTMILARLLTPEDYGLLAMVMPLVIFVGLLKDFGLTSATIQMEQISSEQINSLFWITLLVGLVLFTLVVICAPVIGWFYSDPRATSITIALATTFILYGLSAQPRAILRREMKFNLIARVEILAQFAGIVTAIIMAVLGYGYWSLVALYLVNELFLALLVWKLTLWRPDRHFSLANITGMLKFGANVSGSQLFSYMGRQADNILIGWRYGAAQLGLYAKAYGLLMLPLEQLRDPLSGVIIPALSRLRGLS